MRRATTAFDLSIEVASGGGSSGDEPAGDLGGPVTGERRQRIREFLCRVEPIGGTSSRGALDGNVAPIELAQLLTEAVEVLTDDADIDLDIA